MSTRFQDNGESVYSFTDTTYVECPKCGSCAVSTLFADKESETDTEIDWFAPRRLTCVSCGYNAKWKSREIHRQWQSFKDDYFGLPLWLQTHCRGEVLWAYNERHLELIESIAKATLRERARDGKYGWANQSLISRLPAWIKAKKNRKDVLDAISRLRSERLIHTH